VRKLILAFILALGLGGAAFAQNLLMLGGEYNFMGPAFWDTGLGFNFKLYQDYIQNDTLLSFGTIKSPGDKANFLVCIGDKLYYEYDLLPIVGFRAGLSAGLGLSSGSMGDGALNLGGFAGVLLFPQSLISAALDVGCGYLWAFNAGKSHKNYFGILKKGLVLPLALNIRLNLDRLS
jgi:hypothetical protein